jgi:hypothetical protein
MKNLLVIILILFQLSAFSQQNNPSKINMWNSSRTVMYKAVPMGWYPQEQYDTTVQVSMLCSWHGVVRDTRGYVIRQAQEYMGDAMPNGVPGYYDTRWEAIGYLDAWKAPLNKDVIIWNVKILK